MIVCSCNVLSDAQIRASIAGDLGPRTPGAVHRCLGSRPSCGRCFATIETLLAEGQSEKGRGDAAAKENDAASPHGAVAQRK